MLCTQEMPKAIRPHYHLIVSNKHRNKSPHKNFGHMEKDLQPHGKRSVEPVA